MKLSIFTIANAICIYAERKVPFALFSQTLTRSFFHLVSRARTGCFISSVFRKKTDLIIRRIERWINLKERVTFRCFTNVSNEKTFYLLLSLPVGLYRPIHSSELVYFLCRELRKGFTDV